MRKSTPAERLGVSPSGCLPIFRILAQIWGFVAAPSHVDRVMAISARGSIIYLFDDRSYFMRFHSIIRNSGVIPLLAGIVFFAGGCKSDSKARAVVKGKVTFANKNLTAGTVMFWGPNNATSTSVIEKDGSYEMKDAPIGDVKITVTVPRVPKGGFPKMGFGGPAADTVRKMEVGKDPVSGKSIQPVSEAPTDVLPIPDRYGEPATSGLTYKVEKGEHTYNIDLKP
jgi:hypothetical protein